MTAVISFHSNPNVGLYGFCTDKYCLLGRDVPEHEAKQIEHALKVPLHRLNIAGTSLLGVFLNGNSRCLLVPDLAFPEELRKLDQFDIPYEVIHTRLTCLGNNMIVGEKAAFLSKEFAKETVAHIKKALRVDVSQHKLADIYAIGALAALSAHGMLVSDEMSDQELAQLEETFRVPVSPGTVNMGNTFVRSGILVNKHGLVIGDMSGGPELVNAEQAFGFASR